MFVIGVVMLTFRSSFSLMGLHLGISRFIPYFLKTQQLNKLKGGLLFGARTVAVLGIVIAVSTYLLAPWIASHIFSKEGLVPIIRIFALTLPFFSVLQYAIGIFRGIKNMSHIVYCNYILLWGIRIAVLCVIIWFGISTRYIVLSYLLSAIAVVAVAFVLIRKTPLYAQLKDLSPAAMGRELTSFCLPLTFSDITAIFRKRFDVLLVGYFLSTQEVGTYGAAFAIAILLKFLPTALNRILMPVASGLCAENNITDLTIIYKKVAKFAIAINLPLFLTLFVHPELFLQMLFGDKFPSAALPLRILAIGFFFNALTGSFGEILQSFGHTRAVMWISVTGTCSNLPMMIFLVPRFGVVGAASSMTISLVLMATMGLLILRQMKGITPFNREYHTVLASGVIFSCIVMIGRSFTVGSVFKTAVSLGVLTMVYFLVLYGSGILRNEDIALFSRRKTV